MKTSSMISGPIRQARLILPPPCKPMEPLITMYQMILGGLGVGGAMAWKAK